MVDIDKYSGFCFGVTRAIEMAESELNGSDSLFSLGSIVHNEQEVERLGNIGLRVIDEKQYSELESSTVLFRAHGEPPHRYIKAKEKGIELIDATCPVVLKLQQRIKKSYDLSKGNGGQIVIYGKKGHAEVVGLEGQTDFNAIVIQSYDDLTNIDFTKPIYLFSQTTQSVENFIELSGEIKELSEAEVFSYDTICRQVSDRKPKLIEFVKRYDVVVFVGGKQSSNGKYLYGICKEHNPHSYFVSNLDEINKGWFAKEDSIGVCGATSTPRWQMEDVARAIEDMVR